MCKRGGCDRDIVDLAARKLDHEDTTQPRAISDYDLCPTLALLRAISTDADEEMIVRDREPAGEPPDVEPSRRVGRTTIRLEDLVRRRVADEPATVDEAGIVRQRQAG